MVTKFIKKNDIAKSFRKKSVPICNFSYYGFV